MRQLMLVLLALGLLVLVACWVTGWYMERIEADVRLQPEDEDACGLP